MKKKRFYNNKKRNSKWTETETGRKISFADKYIEAGTGSDKFDSKRPRKKRKNLTREKNAKLFKSVLTVIFCFVFLSVGYCMMDLYIDRNAMPETEQTQTQSANLSAVNLNFKSLYTESISLDNGVMLDAVIDSAEDGGYTSVTFDLKRDDGTVGYESELAAIGAYGAVSSASAALEKSVAKLNQSDIIPIARISCYKDNIAAQSDIDGAVKSGKSLYKDSDGYMYLDPNAETTYTYIKSIIEETSSMGITVFLLDNCTLPDDVKGDYDDGFSSLSKQLYADFGDEIKLIEAIDVEITDDTVSQSYDYSDETDEDTDEYDTQESYASDEYDDYDSEEYSQTTDEYGDYVDEEATSESQSSGIEAQVEEKISASQSNSKAYYIKTNNPDAVKKILDKKNITNYVIVASDAE